MVSVAVSKCGKTDLDRSAAKKTLMMVMKAKDAHFEFCLD